MFGNLEKAKLKGVGKGKCDEMFTFWNAQFGVRETPHSFPSIICHFELDFYFKILKFGFFRHGESSYGRIIYWWKSERQTEWKWRQSLPKVMQAW